MAKVWHLILKEKEVAQVPHKKNPRKRGEETRKTYLSLVASKIYHFETGESKPTLSLMALSVTKWLGRGESEE